MAGSKRVDISVPEEIYKEVCIMVYTRKYMHNPKSRIVLQLLIEHKDKKTPLSKLVYLLREEHKISRRVEGLRKMAEECGIPFTL